MNKRGRGNWGVLVFFILGVSFILYQVLAAQPFVTTSTDLTVFNINEDVSVNLNITINNTEDGQSKNITQVNVTVTNPGLASTPSGYNFTTNTNGTSGRTLGTGAGNHTFLNTSGSTSVLSWTNTSYFVVNGSNGSFVEFFFFNVTFTTPGNYTLQVLSMNASGGVNQTNITVQVNDTTFPTIALENTTNGVFANSSNFSVNAIFINVTITELNESNITFILFNTSTNVNTTTFTNTGNRSLNVTGLSDGNFTYNVTVVDLANNRNTSATRSVVLDTTLPTSLTFGNETQNVRNNASNVSANAIFFNFTFTEINARNVTFTLYNTSTNVNTTTFDGRGTVTLNVTGLFDGNFTYNITVTDIVNQRNSTETRNILLDTTLPIPAFENTTNGVPANSSNVTGPANANSSSLFFNVTVTEILESNITFTLYNTSTNVNTTTFSTRQRTLNVTGLADGNYTYNITVVDTASNRNATETRNLIIDATFPVSAAFGNSTQGVFDNSSNISAGALFMNFTFTEINVRNITFSLANATASVNVTTFAGRGTTTLNVTGLADGNYTYNITVTDIVNQRNFTATRSVVLDTTFPLLSLGNSTHNVKINDSNLSVNAIFINLTSITEININNITFRLHNATASVNVTTFSGRGTTSLNMTGLADGNYSYNVTICDITHHCNTTTTQTIRLDNQAPTAPSFSCTPTSVRQNDVITCTCSGGADVTVGINRSFGSNGYSFSINPSTSFTGVFTTTCDVKDLVGLTSSSSLSYTVSHALTGGGSGGGGGGATGAIYVVRSEQSEAGFAKELEVNDQLKVTISDNSQHTVTVNQITPEGKVKIIVKSDPVELVLGVGETKKAEVTGDDYYDLAVTLNSVKNGKASVAIKSIHEIIVKEKATDILKSSEEEILDVGKEVADEKESNVFVWIIIGIIILILAVIIVKLVVRKK